MLKVLRRKQKYSEEIREEGSFNIFLTKQNKSHSCKGHFLLECCCLLSFEPFKRGADFPTRFLYKVLIPFYFPFFFRWSCTTNHQKEWQNSPQNGIFKCANFICYLCISHFLRRIPRRNFFKGSKQMCLPVFSNRKVIQMRSHVHLANESWRAACCFLSQVTSKKRAHTFWAPFSTWHLRGRIRDHQGWNEELRLDHFTFPRRKPRS